MIASGTRALVTGGAGFIGAHLVRALLDAGCSVVVLDNFLKRPLAQLDLPHATAVTVIEGDLRDRDSTIAAVASAEADLVVHLAAHHFIPFCVANPAEALRLNVLGTQHLVDGVMATRQCRRFILASTADVYAPSERPHTESDRLAAENVYGASKRLSEELVAFSARQSPTIKFLVARFFNVYGPGETNPHLIPDILDALAIGAPLRLGNLEPRRDYVYVGDVIEALLRLGRYDGASPVFNVGTGRGSSAREVVRELERVLERPITIDVDPSKVRHVDRPSLVADPSLARNELGFVATTSLHTGLRRMLAEAKIV